MRMVIFPIRRMSMRSKVATLQSAAMAVLVAMSAAGSAAAAQFSPAAVSFTLSGALSMSINGVIRDCPITATGATSANGKLAQIQSFSGSGAGCSIQGMNLPWKVKPQGAGAAVIHTVTYAYPNLICGPRNSPVSISATGAWAMTFGANSGNCFIYSGQLSSNPVVTVAP